MPVLFAEGELNRLAFILMHSPSKILLRSFLAPEQGGEEPRAESSKSQNNTFHNLVVAFIRAGRGESPSPALGARGMQINRTLALASSNNQSNFGGRAVFINISMWGGKDYGKLCKGGGI